ncbi:MAG: hypothetical protein PHU98_06105 [Mariniphaga sp.]|nr:hypothetical protein [Mariniphaga sp.]
MEKIIKVRHPRGEETELPLTAWTKFEEMYRNKGFVPIAEIEAMLKPPVEVTERVNENQIKEFIGAIPPVPQSPVIESDEVIETTITHEVQAQEYPLTQLVPVQAQETKPAEIPTYPPPQKPKQLRTKAKKGGRK